MTFVLILGLAQALLLVALSLQAFWLFALILSFALLFVFTLYVEQKGAFLLSLIPLSQGIPIKSGPGTVSLFPEYLLIPVVFLVFVFMRLRDRKFVFERTGLVAPAALFIVVAAISLLYNGGAVGFSKATLGFATLYIYMLALMLFIVVLHWLRDEQAAIQLLLFLFGSSIIIAVVGIGEYFLRPGVSERLYRISSLFGSVFTKEIGGNPNALGAYLMMMALLAVAMRRVFSGGRKLLTYASLVSCLVALVLTSSRSSLIGFVVGLLIIGLLRDRKILLTLIPAGLAAVYYLVTMPRLVNRIISIVSIATDPQIFKFFSAINPKLLDWGQIANFGLSGYNIDIVAGALRFSLWLSGIKTFLAHPLLGVGLKMSLFSSGYETAENYLLDIAVMTGCAGLLLTLWLLRRLFVIMRTARKRAESPFERSYVSGFLALLVGVMIVSFTGSILFSMKLMLTFSLLVAILWRTITTNEHTAAR